MPWDKEERENDEKSENDEEDEFMEDVSKPYSSKDVPLFRIDPMKMIRNKGEYKKIKQCNSKAELDTYIRLNIPATTCKRNNRNESTACDVRKYHKMNYIENPCKCNIPHCNLLYKILKCDCSDNY